MKKELIIILLVLVLFVSSCQQLSTQLSKKDTEKIEQTSAIICNSANDCSNSACRCVDDTSGST